MADELRKTGISVVGDVPWGTHLCHFYETKEDLLDILIPYFKAGLENEEFCIWVVSDPLGEGEARDALRQAVPEADRYLAAGHIEIVPYTRFPSSRERGSPAEHIEIIPHTDWYLKDGAFIAERVLNGWNQKLADALAKGYAGLRANGNEAWLTEENREAFSAYEKTLDESLAGQRMIVLCSYPLAGSSAAQIFDVVNTHQLGILRRRGKWERIETPEPIQAKAEIKRLNKELGRALDKRSEPPAILTYGIAVLSVIAAVIILLLMDTSLQAAAHVSLFLCAVIFSTWFGGIRPGLLAIVLSVLAFAYILPPPESFAVEIPHLPRLLLFALLAFFVESLTAAQRNKAASLRRARDVLNGTVQQLKQTNEALRREIIERKRAEEGLRLSEDRIRLIIDTIPVMAWSVRPDGSVDFLNQRWLDYSGLSFEEYIEDPTGPIHPEDVPNIMEKWRASMAVGKPYEAEMRLRRADGEYRWFLVLTEPLRDEHENIVKWYGVSIDIEERKQAEGAVRQSEERFAAFMDNLPGYAWMKDLQGRYVYVNEMVEGLPGYESLGKTDAQIWPADLAAEYRANDQQVIATKRPLQTVEHFQQEGKQRYMVGSKFPVFDKTGAVALVGGAGVDITERIEAEAALRESEAKLKQAQQLANIGYWERDLIADRITWSKETGRILGLESLRGVANQAQLREFIHPDDRQHHQQVLDEALQGSRLFDVEFRFVRPDGNMRFVHVRDEIVRDESGKPIRMFGAVQDLTERIEAEEALRESEERFREVTENIREVFWLASDDFSKMLYISPAYEAVWGRTRESLYREPRSFINAIHPEDRARVVDVIERERERGFEVEYRVVQPKGSIRWIRERGFGIKDESGHFYRVAGISEDVTERKRAEQELKAITEQLRALSASLQSAREEEGARIAREIHDELGSRLTSLKWDLEGINRILSDSGAQERLSELCKKVDAMIELTDATIDTIRRISSELRPSILDDLGLIAAIEWQASEFQTSTGIVCTCDCLVENVGLNRKQSTAVFRILQEALTNVLRHAQATKVDIMIKEVNGQFVLTVSDNGRGITETEKLGLRSLGLLGMKERARLNGGEVDITRNEEGGTVVIVQLPIASDGAGSE